MSTSFVLDSSLALSWCFGDEATDATEAVLDLFGEGATAYVPALWAWEVNNILCLAERTKRLSRPERVQKSSLLRDLTIELDEPAHRNTWDRMIIIAQEHKLSLYDATYLEMALRLNLALGSLDKELRSAGKKAGVKLLPQD